MKENIQPSVNPKPLTVQRVQNEIYKDGVLVGYETLLIKNVQIDPRER